VRKVIREDAAFAALLEKIERESGFRGSLYRQKCLRRRVAVRMRALGVTTPQAYAALLEREPSEYKRLLRVLTINVSKFFRDRETWEAIRSRVLPQLLARDSALMWSAGSAAGEEAYSLAIFVWEWKEQNGDRSWDGTRIIGTDIDQASLEAARVAEYSELALSETPVEFRRRWFSADPPFRLQQPIPSLVEFRHLDVLAGRPEFDCDLILCRNLLIYLDRPAQDRVFKTFVSVLRPGGYLVLGRVETLGASVRDGFETIDARERIFRRR